jgi:hypothetical protein
MNVIGAIMCHARGLAPSIGRSNGGHDGEEEKEEAQEEKGRKEASGFLTDCPKGLMQSAATLRLRKSKGGRRSFAGRFVYCGSRALAPQSRPTTISGASGCFMPTM